MRVYTEKSCSRAWSLAGRVREPHAGMKILSALACDDGFFYFKTALDQNCSNPFYRLLPIIM